MPTRSSSTETLVALSLALGLMLSPDWLALVGNATGELGYFFLVALVCTGILYALVARSYRELSAHFPGPGMEAQALEAAFGRLPAMVLLLCSRVPFFVCASTLVLATAGYVFNETFVRWFPNLGFSFCLLALLVGMQLYSERLAEIAQVVFVSIAWAGLLTLSLVGLFAFGSVSPIPYVPPQIFHPGLQLWLIAMLPVGCELGMFARPLQPRYHVMCYALVLVIGLLLLWGIISLRYVTPDRLADTSIPHIIVARTLLGQPGRVMIGIVALAGTCSAVNALLLATSRMIATMAARQLLPKCLDGASSTPRIPLLLLALGPALMMGSGMAGEPETETFTRAGFLFWLALYGAMHLAALRLRWQSSMMAAVPASLCAQSLGYGALFVVGVAVVWYEPERGHLGLFMLKVLGSALVLSLIFLVWRRGILHKS